MTVDERISFEVHRGRCARCGPAVESWQQARHLLGQFVEQRSPDPTAYRAAQLVEGVEKTGAIPRPLVWSLGAVAVSVVFALGFFYFLNRPSPHPLPDPAASLPQVAFEWVYPPAGEGSHTVAKGDVLQTRRDEQLLVQAQNTRLGLRRSSRVKVVDVTSALCHVQLLRGKMAVELTPRPHRETLLIEVGKYRVSVTGTRFWVTKKGALGVEVGVTRGMVDLIYPNGVVEQVMSGTKLEVTGDGPDEMSNIIDRETESVERLLTPPEPEEAQEVEEVNDSDTDLEGGEMIFDFPLDEDEDGDTDQEFEHRPGNRFKHRGPRAASAPPLTEIRQWVLDGEYDRAEEELKQRVSRAPRSGATLELLAACLRKQGKFEEAADAYVTLTGRASPVGQARARFKAGVIYQQHLNRHKEAVSMFRAYLSAPPAARPNTVEARMRLARSLRQLGMTGPYRVVLQTIVTEHKGSDAAQKAKQLLSELDE